MDFRQAEFVRVIEDHECVEDLIDEAKADTWTREQEHALLMLRTSQGERFVMVEGVAMELYWIWGMETGLLRVMAEVFEVTRLGWHVHPQPTGPSDHDRNVLDLLDQENSMLYEINGPRGGTLFTRMSNRRM